MFRSTTPATRLDTAVALVRHPTVARVAGHLLDHAADGLNSYAAAAAAPTPRRFGLPSVAALVVVTAVAGIVLGSLLDVDYDGLRKELVTEWRRASGSGAGAPSVTETD